MDEDGSYSHSTFGNLGCTFNQKNYAAKILIPGSSLTLYTGTPSFCHFRAPAHNVGAPNNVVFLNFANYCKPKKRCGKIIIIYLSTLFLLSEKSYKSLMCLMIINKYNSNCVGVLSKTFDITDQH